MSGINVLSTLLGNGGGVPSGTYNRGPLGQAAPATAPAQSGSIAVGLNDMNVAPPRLPQKDTSEWLAQTAGDDATNVHGRPNSGVSDVPPNSRFVQALSDEIVFELALRTLTFIPKVVGHGLRWIGQAANGGRRARVIGHTPDYVNVGKQTGMKYLEIPEAEWDALSHAQREDRLRQFLDEGMEAGEDFVITNNPARQGSWLEFEIKHILESGNGYGWNPQGTALVPQW
jgi:hypothetical protein